MTRRLAARATITRDDMPLSELLRPLSARALPRSALHRINGETITEDEARWIEHRRSTSEHHRYRREKT